MKLKNEYDIFASTSKSLLVAALFVIIGLFAIAFLAGNATKQDFDSNIAIANKKQVRNSDDSLIPYYPDANLFSLF